MEGGPAVCYLTGAMNSLLNKLHKLEMKHRLVDAFLPDLESLRKDLQDSFTGGPATGEQLKAWRKQVRELVYDMEDWIDPRLAAELGESETEQTDIEIFKTRIQEARGRCRRYGLLISKAPNTDANLVDAAPSQVTVDPGLLWEEKKKKNALVGMDGPRRDLEKDLNDKRKKIKVVSIVGEGGHGKTTLAKEMYQKFKGQFNCRAFLSLHGNTFTRTTLLDILHQVNPSADEAATSTWDEQRVITELCGFLRTERYFIIIDNIRSTCTWKVISGVLPFNNHGSRILTTTCSKDVAISCSRRPSDVIYQMKDLGEEDSIKLLGSMISAPKEDRPVDFKEVSGEMLKVCGGIPFAIILTAALLDWKSAQLGPRKQIKQSILPLLDQYSMSASGMRKTLEMSFDDLSMPLKSCFLYMSVFPENCVVKKDSLIRRWIAEGFIRKIDGESLLETGENYFNELVSRKLIHPVFHIDDFQPIACTVHDVVADFVKSLSIKENFVTTGEELSSGSPRDSIRRFLLDYSGQRKAGGTVASIMVHISRARTLTVVGDVKEMSDLSAFRLVRVLDLEDTDLRNDQLKGIGCLVLLKYLGLAGTRVTKIPEEIIKLTHLETLDIRRNGRLQNIEALTAKLVSLLADDVQLPSKMVEALQRLEELSTVLVDGDYKPEDAAQLVSELQQLKVLSVRANRQWDQRDLKRFFQALKHSKLMSLTLDCSLEGLDNWTPSSSLRRFQLKRFLSSVPQGWESLYRLTHLDIRIGQVEPSDAVVLGKLPTLILLKLDARNYSPEGRVTINEYHGFLQLKVAWFLCHSGGMGLQLVSGAMKQLQRLRLEFNVQATRERYGNEFDFGIQFPGHLREVHVAVVNCSDSTSWDVLTAEDAIKQQVKDNPGKPYLEIARDGEPLKEKQASPSGVKSKPAEREQVWW